ncbi:hypothetical protein [Aneurinibacillus migulanus]|jgi:hypothetical protein|uniref:DUF3953 domain-containing protein n=1 Tax=Aneurinibacillus migulanus TaxID=47500 RepID=A0A0D1XNA2_ANEMI|nr:hypothetical protein [Aneurinibacillus migulanus]KIV55841.1 hypothetical protein TS65_13940 [Aneurinibacillus migulanus]KON97761.1 hypothetical protein AF333_22335 [Aneurinibacillus migulanus]MED0894314.1 hypothetical protein [Aneurinibacillus migulanus]MED1619806.1 hypothetical protein [Aneurinibacillus migulanus]SDK57670.1 hypothetical protein SAMN04487909_1753 [Aneurinibacillus migulanus]
MRGLNLSILSLGLFILYGALFVGGIITNFLMLYICILLPFFAFVFAAKEEKSNLKTAITVISGFVLIAVLLLLYLIIFQTG